MVTPEGARKLADAFDEAGKFGPSNVLRDLADQVEALQADAERLDWLDKEISDGEPKRIACLPGCLRNVIDAAREAE